MKSVDVYLQKMEEKGFTYRQTSSFLDAMVIIVTYEKQGRGTH